MNRRNFIRALFAAPFIGAGLALLPEPIKARLFPQSVATIPKYYADRLHKELYPHLSFRQLGSFRVSSRPGTIRIAKWNTPLASLTPRP